MILVSKDFISKICANLLIVAKTYRFLQCMDTRRIVIIFMQILSIFFIPSVCMSEEERETRSEGNNLRDFLRNYSLPSMEMSGKDMTRYSFASAYLRGGKVPEVIVYLVGDSWCGSGGCTLLVLEPAGSSYKVVSNISAIRPPIRVLPNKTNGWKDLSVWIEGGGVHPGYSETLFFNGKKYRYLSKTSKISHTAKQDSKGEIVLPLNFDGELLYR